MEYLGYAYTKSYPLSVIWILSSSPVIALDAWLSSLESGISSCESYATLQKAFSSVTAFHSRNKGMQRQSSPPPLPPPPPHLHLRAGAGAPRLSVFQLGSEQPWLCSVTIQRASKSLHVCVMCMMSAIYFEMHQKIKQMKA